jgi:hypothetical protein
MTLAEIQARVRYLSKKEAEDKLSSLILGAIAAQGNKESINKVSSQLRNALKN